MKKIITLVFVLLINTVVFGQRRELKPPPHQEEILFSTFTKKDLKRLQYNKIKKNNFPYLEIMIGPSGKKDSTIYGFSKPLMEMDKIKKGLIPVFIYSYNNKI